MKEIMAIVRINMMNRTISSSGCEAPRRKEKFEAVANSR